jgi:hypothetical protein
MKLRTLIESSYGTNGLGVVNASRNSDYIYIPRERNECENLELFTDCCS